MAAKCPHYREDCDDSTSSRCHYIKNTTGVATGTLGLSLLYAPHYLEFIDRHRLEMRISERVSREDIEFCDQLIIEFLDFLKQTREKRSGEESSPNKAMDNDEE